MGKPTPCATTGRERLHIWLRKLTRTRYVWDVPGEPFDEVWPDPGEPGWDHGRFEDLETPAAIRSLSGPGTPFKNRRGREVLDVALGEGFNAGAPLDTPEDVLLALYTAWVEMEVLYEEEMRAFEAEHLPDGLRRFPARPAPGGRRRCVRGGARAFFRRYSVRMAGST